MICAVSIPFSSLRILKGQNKIQLILKYLHDIDNFEARNFMECPREHIIVESQKKNNTEAICNIPYTKFKLNVMYVLTQYLGTRSKSHLKNSRNSI